METIDIILKSLILIAFIACVIGLYEVSSTIHNYLWHLETKKGSPKTIELDGLWKKTFQNAVLENKIKYLEKENKELEEALEQKIEDNRKFIESIYVCKASDLGKKNKLKRFVSLIDENKIIKDGEYSIPVKNGLFNGIEAYEFTIEKGEIIQIGMR